MKWLRPRDCDNGCAYTVATAFVAALFALVLYLVATDRGVDPWR